MGARQNDAIGKQKESLGIVLHFASNEMGQEEETMPKVVIDPGHGGRDPGAVYGERQEKADALALALAVGEVLERNGVDVVYTRTTDVYNSPYEKAVIANHADADYVLSIHRNSSETPGVGSGVQTLVYEEEGTSAEMARNINRELGELGFRELGVVERPNLVILRRTKNPAVLVEVGFVNNEEDNALFDAQFDAVAEAIATGVLETITEDAPADDRVLYRVQVGAYRRSANANAELQQLLRQGFPAFVLYEDGLYKVQAGAFEELDNAVRMEQTLRRAGYNTFITT